MLKIRHVFLATSATVALGYALPAVAQDEMDSSDAPAVSSSDDIIVTARRRDERLQDVPLAVSAVSQETLARAQITNVQELRRVAPSLTTTPGIAGGALDPQLLDPRPEPGRAGNGRRSVGAGLPW